MITCMGVYKDGVRTPDSDVQVECVDLQAARGRLDALVQAAKEAGGYLWLSLPDPSQAEIAIVADVFGLDPLLVDDSTSPQQRAKVEYAPDHFFVLLKILEWVDETSDVETGQIACFIGDDYAISVRHGQGLEPSEAQQRLAANPSIAALGPMAVFWAVADVAVDEYLSVGDAIQSDIEEIEQEVFSARPANAATRIYRLNRENIEMRRAVRPLALEAMRLARGEDVGLPAPLIPFFRDIGDHLLRANDMVDGFDSTLMTMLMASTARQDLQQNADMRKISAWAAIIAVPTCIAGIYGMNFDFMPELHWPFAYPVVLGTMATICILLYRGFKKSGWL